MKFRAVRASYGFLGRYWDEGDEGEAPEGTILDKRLFVSMEPKQDQSVPAEPAPPVVPQQAVPQPAEVPKAPKGKRKKKSSGGPGAA